MWLSEPFTRGQAWVDMVLLANYKSGWIRKRGAKVEVSRGQIGWSEVALSERWKWSRGKLRRFFKELEKTEKIVQQKTNITSLISIVNYDSYQKVEQQTVQQTDSKRYSNKKGKKGKKTYTDEFVQFWGVYPKKKGKQKAFEAWQKHNGDLPLLDDLLKIVGGQAKSRDWTKDGGQYIPHPATWLNNKRWEDEPTKIADDDEPPYWS